jgi:hypothetical protein
MMKKRCARRAWRRAPGGGSHKHRGGGNIEGIRAIAASADDIDHIFGIDQWHFGREFAHDLCRCGDFTDAFF